MSLTIRASLSATIDDVGDFVVAAYPNLHRLCYIMGERFSRAANRNADSSMSPEPHMASHSQSENTPETEQLPPARGKSRPLSRAHTKTSFVPGHRMLPRTGRPTALQNFNMSTISTNRVFYCILGKIFRGRREIRCTPKSDHFPFILRVTNLGAHIL